MKILKKIRLRHVLWGIAFVLVNLYIHCMLYFPLDPYKLTAILLLKIFIVAIVCNIGLLLITLDVAKKYKKTSTLFFIPSITITPVMVGLYFIPAFFIVLFMNTYFFIKLNPWKKDEVGSICS
jgi:glucose-6-phosphate-specific signal transduction histidine kinase